MNRNRYNRWFWLLLLLFIVGGLYNPVIGLTALICMAAPVIMAAARGRMWCGRLCPRGSFFDQVLSRIGPYGRKVPGFLKKPAVRWAVFVILTAFMVFNILFGEMDAPAVGKMLFMMVAVTTLIGIVLGYFFSPRTWCAICPMGTLSMVISSRGEVPAVEVEENCRSCGICTRYCPMDIPVHSYKGKVTHPDCIKCGICIDVCPFDALRMPDKDRMTGDNKVIS